MVEAKLVEQLLLKPEVRDLNPVNGKISIEHLFTVNCVEMTKIKTKKARNGPFLRRREEYY